MSKKSFDELKKLEKQLDVKNLPDGIKGNPLPNTYEEYLENQKKNPTYSYFI